MDTDLTYKQKLKEEFFKNSAKTTSLQNRSIGCNIKTATNILLDIANKKNFSPLRLRYKLKLVLSKILLKNHMEWVLYSIYSKNILYIATPNHIAQSELNMQKRYIFNSVKQIESFKDLIKVNIIRDTKYKKLEKFVKENKKIDERSYAIFDNNLTDVKLHSIVENIRDIIIKNRQLN